jgi:predicted RNA-binding Zn-ribbon protein involved in translation (DUF1610 family)
MPMHGRAGDESRGHSVPVLWTERGDEGCMIKTHSAAKIVSISGVREWHCPNCGTKLAEILGRRVVIRVRDRLISLRSDVEPDQVCWKCGTTSNLERESIV